MFARFIAPVAAIAVLGGAASADAGVQLQYRSDASFADGKYADGTRIDPGANEQAQGKGDYALAAKVNLRRRGGRWVGKGRLRWRSAFYQGEDCFSDPPNVRFGANRASTFRVTAKLRISAGRVRNAELIADPGFPAVRVDREPIPVFGPCAYPKQYWNGRFGLISPAPGWRSLFTYLHVAAESERERSGQGDCYESRDRCFGSNAAPKVVIRDWRYSSSGRMMASKRYPTANRGNSAFKRAVSDSWKLVRTR